MGTQNIFEKPSCLPRSIILAEQPLSADSFNWFFRVLIFGPLLVEGSDVEVPKQAAKGKVAVAHCKTERTQIAHEESLAPIITSTSPSHLHGL